MAFNLSNTTLKRGTVLIGGGTGFIGTALSNLLTESGYNAIAVSRKPGLNRMSWEEVEKNGLPEKCVAVVNLAGQNVLDPTRRWTAGFKQNVYASRVRTTELLAKSIEKAKTPPSVFVCMSGVGFYKPSETDEYNEDSPGGDHDFLSRLCKDWEEASNISESTGTRRAIVRSGVVLGRKGGMVKQLIWPYFFFLGGPVGSGTQFMPWIHLHDLIYLFRHIITKKDCNGIFNGVAPDVITNGEFANAFGQAMYRPSFVSLPVFALNWAFNEERAVMMTKGQNVIPKRTLESGFEYKYSDIDSALDECARLFVKRSIFTR